MLLLSCTGDESDSDKCNNETTITYPTIDTNITETSETPIVTSPPPETPPTPRPPRPHHYAGMSIPMPEHIVVDPEEFFWWTFERTKRSNFHSIRPSIFVTQVGAETVIADIAHLVTDDEFMDWLNAVTAYHIDNFSGKEAQTHFTLDLIKYFDFTFEEVLAVTILGYEIALILEHDITHEISEISNPYLLFTFNTERINQFYSIDPAEHAEARQWLIDWLEAGNVPYESYSAFRAANPL